MRFGICLLLLLIGPARAEELVVHFHPRPPYAFLVDGQLSGLSGTPIAHALKRAGIAYAIQETPAARQLAMAKESKGAHCFVGWYRTHEREHFARFSRPVYRDQPNIVLFNAASVNAREIASLAQLLASTDLILLSKKGYSYGPAIDAMLAGSPAPRQEVTVENVQMIKMLHARRADYIFMAPEELDPLLAAANRLKTDFSIRAFSDMPAGQTRHLMCTRAVDPALLARFDAALE